MAGRSGFGAIPEHRADSGLSPSWERATIPGMARRVLIVDDHAEFRALARALLERDGFEVVGEAVDGAGTLTAVARTRPEVVLLDVQLPGVNGFDVARTLCEGEDAPVVVMISTRDAADFGGRLERSGARGFSRRAACRGGTRRAGLVMGAPAVSAQSAPRRRSVDPLLLLPLAVAGGLLATRAALSAGLRDSRAAINLALAWSFAAAALLALARPSARRAGWLMAAVAAASYLEDLQLSSSPLAWTAGLAARRGFRSRWSCSSWCPFPTGGCGRGPLGLPSPARSWLTVGRALLGAFFLPDGRNLLLVAENHGMVDAVDQTPPIRVRGHDRAGGADRAAVAFAPRGRADEPRFRCSVGRC